MQDWAERQRDRVELRLLELQLRNDKVCECGEQLTNDTIGEVCHACGRSSDDYTDDIALMSSLTPGLLDPSSARASRAIH